MNGVPYRRHAAILKPAATALISAVFFFAQTTVSFSAEQEVSEESPIPLAVSKELLKLFEPGQFPADGDAESALRYRLFRPAVMKGTRYPLIVYLHGYGMDEFNYENVGQLIHLQTIVFHHPLHPEEYQFFFLAPWLPNPPGDWYRSLHSYSKAAENVDLPPLGDSVVLLVEELIAKYPIDPDRVTLFGVSGGANSSWEMAMRHPDRFAGVAPLASVGGTVARLNRILRVPFWAFQSEGDHPEGVRRSIAWLSQMGGCCRLTEIRGDDHQCWDQAFTEQPLLSWLLSQKRGAPCTFAVPEISHAEKIAPSVMWQSALDVVRNCWPQASLFVVLAICALAWRQEARRRRSRPTPPIETLRDDPSA
jgi:predicted peptidase